MGRISVLSVLILLIFSLVGIYFLHAITLLNYQNSQLNNAWNNVIIQYDARATLLSNLINELNSESAVESNVVQQIKNVQLSYSTIQWSDDLMNDQTSLLSFQVSEEQLQLSIENLITILNVKAEHISDKELNLAQDLYLNQNKIDQASSEYSKLAVNYNEAIKIFPNNWISYFMQYAPKAYFLPESTVLSNSNNFFDF
ncbi:MAG: LemA family protein [Burkholderiales bacterium]|nr:LemA family protein [Burkholderiales bacterium]